MSVINVFQKVSVTHVIHIIRVNALHLVFSPVSISNENFKILLVLRDSFRYKANK